MKTKGRLFRTLSLFMALVLLVTSLQIGMFSASAASGDQIDPYFADDAKINAYFQNDGSIGIQFNKAVARSGYHGDKTITHYLISVMDLTVRENRENVIYNKVITAENSDLIFTEISASDVNTFREINHRYNVAVMAVDNEGWRSMPINATVINVAPFEITEDYSPNPDAAVKYIMRMDSSTHIGSDYNVTGTFNNINADGVTSADAIGVGAGTGNNGSGAMRYWFNGEGDNSQETAVDFSYSRQTYNYMGQDAGSFPEEFLVWVDFTDVKFDEFAFRLRYNDKQPATIGSTDKPSDLVYSTENYDGETVVYMQDENGFWVKNTYPSGEITNIGNYKGFIRIPVECFVAVDGDGNKLTMSDTVHRKYKNAFETKEDDIYPLEDIYSFGFSFVATDESNLHKSFYIDDLAFYRENGEFVKYSDENDSNIAKLGDSIYNRNTALPQAIANYINDNITGVATYADRLTIQNIEEMMKVYGVTDDDLKTADEDAFNTFDAGRTLYRTFENVDDWRIIKGFEEEIEKLPNPEKIIAADEDVINKVKRFYASYLSFNLRQFRLFGSDAEDKLLACYNLVYATKDKVGTALASRPWISFNDFDNGNYPLGTQGNDLYDDYPNAYNADTLINDLQHTTKLTHYSGTLYELLTVSGGINVNRVDYVRTGETKPLSENGTSNKWYANGVESYISNKGYNGSNGATLHFNRDMLRTTRTAMNDLRETATMTFTYNGNSADTWNNLQGLNIENWTDKTIGDTLEERLKELSLVFYLDTTGVTGLDMSIRIVTGNHTYVINNGQNENQRYIRTLDSETGEWNTAYLSSTRQFINGSFTDESGNKVYALDNFRGWVYIPLVYFKYIDYSKGNVGTVGSAQNTSLDVNNDLSDIKEIKVLAQHRQEYYDSNDGASFENKEITVDAFGFTYDPEYYSENYAARQDKGFDEVFGIESTDSKNFVMGVNALDVYADDVFDKYDALIDIYNSLSDYQKSLADVTIAYKQLQELKVKMDTDLILPEKSADEIKAAIDALGSVKNINLDDYRLPSPLVASTVSVDYSVFNTSAEEIAAIAELYEKSYSRMSNADKAALGDDYVKAMENAYAVYERIQHVQKYIDEYNNYTASLAKDVYTNVNVDGTDVSMIELSNKPTILSVLGKNCDSSVFTKSIFEANRSKYVESLYTLIYNTTDITTTTEGNTYKGAFNSFISGTEALTASLAEKIANKTPITAKEIQKVKDIIGKYESFPEQYKNVKDAYDAVEALKALFPQAFAENASVEFNSSTISVTKDVNISYVAALEDIDLYLASSNTFELKSADGNVIPITVDLAGATAAGDKIGTVSNSADDGNGNAVAQTFALTVTVADASQLQPKDYSGTIDISCVSADGTVILSIPVTYAEEEQYVVSIPADQTIPFASTNYNLGEISASIRLNDDKKLTVSLENPENRSFSLVKDDEVVSTIPYTLNSNGNAFVSKEYTMLNKDETVPLVINIEKRSWDLAYVNEYSDTLTFNVACETVEGGGA